MGLPSAADLQTPCNYTIENDFCTYQTCCIAQGNIDYLPTIPGNALFIAIFALLLVAQVFFGIKHRTWSFAVWMFFGLVGEIIGYGGRVWLHINVFEFNAFLMYLIPLTIAPAFITASIYLCLSRVICIVDPTLSVSRLRPMTYTKIFVSFDLVSLILQAAGGAVAAIANDKKTEDMGVHIMVAGLAYQVFSLVVFIALCLDFAVRTRRAGLHKANTTTAGPYDQLKTSRAFRGFLLALAAATILILIRSSYRLAELQEGFSGLLANNEVLFMIFEGPMVILAVSAMTIFHPGQYLRTTWITALSNSRKFERSGAEEKNDVVLSTKQLSNSSLVDHAET